MSILKELDAAVTLADQMKTTEGPVVLVNIFTVDKADEQALLDAWSGDAGFMKKQPGYISTQLHKGLAGSTTWLNCAVWQDVESFRNAFTSPEFQRRLRGYPGSATVSPHLFTKLAVPDFCVA